MAESHVNNVEFSIYNNNKSEITHKDHSICWGILHNSYPLHEGDWLHYKTINNIEEPNQIQFFNFIQSLPWNILKQSIGDLTIEEYNKEGIYLSVDKLNAWQIFFILTLFRYFDEHVITINNWVTLQEKFKGYLTPWEVFVACHTVNKDMYANYHHMLFDCYHLNTLEGLDPKNCEQYFYYYDTPFRIHQDFRYDPGAQMTTIHSVFNKGINAEGTEYIFDVKPNILDIEAQKKYMPKYYEKVVNLNG